MEGPERRSFLGAQTLYKNRQSDDRKPAHILNPYNRTTDATRITGLAGAGSGSGTGHTSYFRESLARGQPTSQSTQSIKLEENRMGGFHTPPRINPSLYSGSQSAHAPRRSQGPETRFEFETSGSYTAPNVSSQYLAPRNSPYEPSIKEEHDADASASPRVMPGDDESDILARLSRMQARAKNDNVRLINERSALEAQLSEKDRDIAELKHRVADLTNQHSHLKTSNKKLADTANRNLAELRRDYEALKAETQPFSQLLTEGREAITAMAEFREVARHRLTQLEPMLDDDGSFIESSSVRRTLDELRSDLLNTQQVTDILRERLRDMSSDLSEARSRGLEVEQSRMQDVRSLEVLSEKYRQNVAEFSDLNSHYQVQRQEYFDTLSKFLEVEQQSSQFGAQAEELGRQVTSLQHVSDEKDGILRGKDGILMEQETELRDLRAARLYLERSIADLEDRARKAEQDASDAKTMFFNAQADSEALRDALRAANEQLSRLQATNEAVTDRYNSVLKDLYDVECSQKMSAAQLSDAIAERDSLREELKVSRQQNETNRARWQESEANRRNLQDRFEEQTVSLKLAKDNVGEIQERLDASETATKTDMAFLQGQLLNMKKNHDDTNGELTAVRTSAACLEKDLACQEVKYQASLSRSEEERLRAVERQESQEREGRRCKEKVIELEGVLAANIRRVEDLQKAYEDAKEGTRTATASLTARVTALEASEKRLIERSNTITGRYKANDLNQNEAALVNTITQQSRAIYEREIATKTNDIRMRDNMIKQHEARIKQLETSLSRRIREEAPSVATCVDRSHDVNEQPTDSEGNVNAHNPPYRARTDAILGATGAGGGKGSGIRPSQISMSNKHVTFADICDDGDDILDFEDSQRSATAGGGRIKRKDASPVVDVDDDEDEEPPQPLRPVKRPQRNSARVPEVEQVADKASATTSNKKGTKRSGR
ncbi:hypothetical protein CONPUDRAFT_159427 [Coniophora puteana RWD-64-598 SS2]|uniref:Uncharacterized protein n=1 Tax=Coniophora puteana (strain RWD-64-598) TaxID=741705 RepID=A0A5M3M7P9_CONPW|nr:uncharacterized protein CONPUDRAFT_159427 [Coniophora puteana RWD-64-598 SS2]EIW75302.1 hypothetical protein CONPUDRAFT_159427 [Coniophora puteana RWD-64-598 SS2]